MHMYREIGEKVKAGALIIYPTDTVYGLGASMDSEEALKKVYKAKSRSFSSPLIALVDSVERIEEIANFGEKKEQVEALCQAFWPGGLTIILKAKDKVPKIMISGGDSIGIRIPKHDMALAILKAAGGILATSSANISGEATPRAFSELSEEIKARADLLIDGGACPIGEASTIIDFSKDRPVLLREGAISRQKIETIIGKL